ncbi:MAG: sensor histidine kinase [Candidatus Merdivicinus sp.]|jgi:two-component system sensor histidine kinase AgrC
MKKELEFRKTYFFIIALNLLQIGAILTLLLLAHFFSDITLDRAETFYLILIGLISVIGGISTILGIAPLNKVDMEIHMLQDSLQNLNELNQDIRAQRHDFLNHIQVVYSLIELEEYQEAHAYLERVYGDIQSLSRVLKTAHPAINAILQAKSDMCRKRGIHLELDISSSLAELRIPSWEFCRILGNLVDNAIYALEKEVPSGQRNIRISLHEDLKHYYFEVENNGPVIPASLWKQIFEPGFTTKGSEGEGMGLAICREIMSDHDGSLEVESVNNRTIFRGSVPR